MSKLVRRKQLELDLLPSPSTANGLFGSTSGNIANVLPSDQLEVAFDKVLKILDKLSPASPPFLNQLNLVVSLNSTVNVTGFLTIDGNSYSNIYKMGNGILTWTTNGTPVITSANGYFQDPTSTTAVLRMTHTYNNTTKQISIGNLNTISSHDGTAGISSGSNGFVTQLNILDKRDFYALDPSASTKSGFYYAIKADMVSYFASTFNDADTLQRTVSMDYSASGTFTDTISISSSYRIESAATPTTSTPVLLFGAMSGLVSGCPSHLVNDSIIITSNITNGIKNYYPSLIGTSTCQGTSNQNNTISGIKTPNSTYSYSATHTVLANQYFETITGSVTPFDVFGSGSTVNSTANNTNRIDTVSIAKITTDASIRKLSPVTGTQFEAISATAYDSTAHFNSLNPSSTSVYSYQLQLLNGVYRYPSVNYSNYGGPNYSSLLQSSWRYCDFVLGSITNRTNITINILGSTNITQIYGTPNFELYIQVAGTTGWLDGNSAWVSGSPSANGDAAVNVASSTATARNITFGNTLSSTAINIRVGINSGSNITFTSISFT